MSSRPIPFGVYHGHINFVRDEYLLPKRGGVLFLWQHANARKQRQSAKKQNLVERRNKSSYRKPRPRPGFSVL